MRQFHELFAGRDDVYGQWTPPSTDVTSERGKVGGDYSFPTAPVTKELYQQHLMGTKSLGIVPLMKNHTVNFFAIDIDQYKDDRLHQEVAHRVEMLGLPLMLCRSKSGGIHLYCFLSSPLSAKIARAAAQEMLSALSLPESTEIFPHSDRSEGHSKFINLPYFGNTRRYMGRDGSTPHSVREFLKVANDLLVDPVEFDPSQRNQQHEEPDTDDEWSIAPPCIQRMVAEGVDEGGRDNALMQFSMFFDRAYPDEAAERLFDANQQFLNPPLPASAVSTKARNAKRYQGKYLCKAAPMCDLCDSEACKKLEHGIGSDDAVLFDSDSNFVIDSILIIEGDDPLYICHVFGKELRLKAEQLINFSQFKLAFVRRFNMIPTQYSTKQWTEIVNTLLASAERQRAPDAINYDIALYQSFMSWVREHINPTGGLPSDLDRNVPYYDFNQGAIIFVPAHFFGYMRKKGERLDNTKLWGVFRGFAQDRGEVWVVKVKNEEIGVKERATI